MTILEQAKAAADEYARDLGGAWIVIGNPDREPTALRDLSITEADPNPFWMFLEGDEVLYRAEAI